MKAEETISTPLDPADDKSRQELRDDIARTIRKYLKPRKESELHRLSDSKITFSYVDERNRNQPIEDFLELVRGKPESQTEPFDLDKE